MYIYIYRHYLKTLSKNVSTTVFFNLISLTQCPSHSNKIKYFLYYNIKLQSNTFVTKEVIIFIVIVNVLFTLFLVKYVAYNMLGQQFTNSVQGGTIIYVHKGFRQKVVLPRKITFINIFCMRTIMDYWRIL